jgi:hypothetical protein
LIELSIFIGLDIVSSCQLSSFCLLFFEFIYFQLMKTSLQLLLTIFLEGNSNLHLSSWDFISLLK